MSTQLQIDAIAKILKIKPKKTRKVYSSAEIIYLAEMIKKGSTTDEIMLSVDLNAHSKSSWLLKIENIRSIMDGGSGLNHFGDKTLSIVLDVLYK